MDLPHWNSCIGLWTFRVYTRSTFRRLTPPDQDVLPLLTCAASEDAAAAAVTCISHRSSCAPQARAPRAPATADASVASVQLSCKATDARRLRAQTARSRPRPRQPKPSREAKRHAGPRARSALKGHGWRPSAAPMKAAAGSRVRVCKAAAEQAPSAPGAVTLLRQPRDARPGPWLLRAPALQKPHSARDGRCHRNGMTPTGRPRRALTSS